MGGDVIDAQRFRVGDQTPEQAAPPGELHLGQVGPLLLRQAHGDEQRETFAFLVQHAQRPIAGAYQAHRGGHDQLQHGVQLRLAAQDGLSSSWVRASALSCSAIRSISVPRRNLRTGDRCGSSLSCVIANA